MDKRKIYISLPITGQEDVAPVVAGYVKECLQKKFPLAEVISPFDVCPGQPVSYAYAMGRDIETLLVCDAVYFVPGWRNSKGCRLERHAALLYNKHIVPSTILPLGELRRYVRKLS